MKKGLFLKTEEELQTIRNSAEVLGRAHAEVANMIEPGISTILLDQRAEEFIRDSGGIPSFKGYNGFPGSLCISVNDKVVHGIPGTYTLKEGDIVSIDCGVMLRGFHSDSAYTYPVGSIDPNTARLLKVTKESLNVAVKSIVPGCRLGDIGFAVQSFIERNKFSVVRELVGHGIGRSLHESPEVPNYGKRGQGMKLQDGMVLAIEPMVNAGTRNIVQEKDGWTIRTADRKPSAHFEHTVAVVNGVAAVLTTFKYIEEVLQAKNGKTVIH